VGNHAVSTGAMVISGNYFHALGVGTAAGRAITADDDTSDGLPSAVISYRFWDRTFGLDPAAIGKTMYVNGQPCLIVGVAPKGFFGVSAGGFMRTPNLDVMLPIRLRERLEGSGGRRMEWFGNDLFWVQVMGRMNAGAESRGKNELASLLMAYLSDENRKELGSEVPRIYLEPGAQGLDTLRSVYHEPLLILMAVVALTLLMACANLAGLLLARANARQKEIMVRLAVGANRGRLVRQLLLEGAVLAAAGAAAGLGFAWWGVKSLVALVAAGSAPIPIDVTPDARVLGFTALVSVATTFLFALVPAVRATRVDVAGGLKEDTPLAAGSHHVATGRILLALQVATALVLLAGATLFTRSLANLRGLPLDS
jgi:predicted permease